MKVMVKIENSISGKSLSLYVGNKRKVNKLMINLIEAGFTVNYEPVIWDLLHRQLQLILPHCYF